MSVICFELSSHRPVIALKSDFISVLTIGSFEAVTGIYEFYQTVDLQIYCIMYFNFSLHAMQ
jgi:hypothetical protein